MAASETNNGDGDGHKPDTYEENIRSDGEAHRYTSHSITTILEAQSVGQYGGNLADNSGSYGYGHNAHTQPVHAQSLPLYTAYDYYNHAPYAPTAQPLPPLPPGHGFAAPGAPPMGVSHAYPASNVPQQQQINYTCGPTATSVQPVSLQESEPAKEPQHNNGSIAPVGSDNANDALDRVKIKLDYQDQDCLDRLNHILSKLKQHASTKGAGKLAHGGALVAGEFCKNLVKRSRTECELIQQELEAIRLDLEYCDGPISEETREKYHKLKVRVDKYEAHTHQSPSTELTTSTPNIENANSAPSAIKQVYEVPQAILQRLPALEQAQEKQEHATDYKEDVNKQCEDLKKELTCALKTDLDYTISEKIARLREELAVAIANQLTEMVDSSVKKQCSEYLSRAEDMSHRAAKGVSSTQRAQLDKAIGELRKEMGSYARKSVTTTKLMSYQEDLHNTVTNKTKSIKQEFSYKTDKLTQSLKTLEEGMRDDGWLGNRVNELVKKKLPQALEARIRALETSQANITSSGKVDNTELEETENRIKFVEATLHNLPKILQEAVSRVSQEMKDYVEARVETGVLTKPENNQQETADMEPLSEGSTP